MHQYCIDFLQNQLNATVQSTPCGFNVHFSSEAGPLTDNRIFPVTHLGICEVNGKDAATFLQGQVTCNIAEVSVNVSRFAALCNPKGRVISPLLILKSSATPDRFFLLTPWDLTKKVIQHLSIFILRADVQLQNLSDQYCLAGISQKEPAPTDDNLPQKPFETWAQDLTSHSRSSRPGDSCIQPELRNRNLQSVNEDFEHRPDENDRSAIDLEQVLTFIRLPGNPNRHLILAPAVQAIDFWQSSLANGFIPSDSAVWRFQDLSAGLPWFSSEQSAKYIPQMLNIDKLNGISFNKGCYTGQEIVARTHYLGKNKREMFLAECEKAAILNTKELNVIESDTRQVIGKLLCFQCIENSCRCLLVMPPEYSRSASLALASESPMPLTIIPFE